MRGGEYIMQGNRTMSRVIPEGELNCIWMEAGLVSYKLCERSYDCENCPFDQVMRMQSRSASSPAVEQKKDAEETKPGKKTYTSHETLVNLISDLFSPPLSVPLPGDRLYSRNHVWMKRVEENLYRVGIDHYAAYFLEGIQSIILPQANSVSSRNNPCAWILCEDGTIAVRSPLNGKTVKSNSKLKDSVYLVNKDPYDSGWISEVGIEGQKSLPKDCCDAAGMESLCSSQFQQLKQDLIADFYRKRRVSAEHSRQFLQDLIANFDRKPPSLGVTLMDGGMRPRNLKDVLGSEKFVSFLQKLLSIKI